MDIKTDSLNKHVLYQTTVQEPKKELEFFRKIYRNIYSRVPISIRETFVGLALLVANGLK